jgi:GAF domain-containing protein
MDALPSAPSAPPETLDETIARLTAELREARDQQAATTEIIEIINRSSGDLAPVFGAMLDKAMRLCEADFGIMLTVDGTASRVVAERDVPKPLIDFLSQHPPEIGPDTFFGRAVLGRSVLHTADMRGEAAYQSGQPLTLTAVDLAGVRALLMAPLRKDDRVSGVFAIFRRDPRAFTDKQIALLQNFAAQAVIAIENARLLTETREALEQQTATAEVLQVINSSPGDLAPVFDAMLEKAMALCEAAHGSLQLYDGQQFRAVAVRGLPERLADLLRAGFRPGPETPMWGLLKGERFVHVPDLAQLDLPEVRFAVEHGSRTTLHIPLRKGDLFLGQIVAVRREVQPFSDKQIALLQNFAAQAVIAMENARLLTETREALEQQTATAEVLQVINSSPGNLAPVFEAMLQKAIRLCGGIQGALWTLDGECAKLAASRGNTPEFVAMLRERALLGPPETVQEIIRGKRLMHIPDLVDHQLYRAGDPIARGAVELSGVRSLIGVPLVKDGASVGAFLIGRRAVRPFSDKQIALLQNFAAQAVIAMENARLLTETREALEQQTATAGVLQVINSSPGDLMPVFDAILEKAHTLCGAAHGSLQLYDGDTLRAVATHAVPDEFADILRQGYSAAASPASRELLEGKPFIQIPDCAEIDHPVVRSAAELVGIRTLLVVPLRRDGTFLGLISAARLEIRPFADKQIALLQNFAAQAVIAMENARLLTETREALEQQTATAEVLQVINSSPGDLTPVFDVILEKAHSLCGAELGTLFTYDGERFWPAAAHHAPPAEFNNLMRDGFLPTAGNPLARVIEGEPLVHIDDIRRVSAECPDDPGLRVAVEGGIRTFLVVPLRKDNVVLGAISALRREIMPFTDRHIALLQNFAAQAVIAMENARLITETREALEQQTATAEVLQVINSSPGDLTPVFGAMLEKALCLCDGVQGSLWTFNGGRRRLAVARGISAQYVEVLREQWERREPREEHPMSRLMRGERVVQILDMSTSDLYRTGDPAAVAGVEVECGRTLMFVSLIKDNAPVGAFIIARREIQAFSDKQIALVQNFAAQAVIAMENARLLTETREALEQQTATAEVLQVINSSPGDLVPVFDAIVKKARRLCGADFGSFYSYDGGSFEVLASTVGDAGRTITFAPGTSLDRVAHGEGVVQIADVTKDKAYREGIGRDRTRHAGTRTDLAVALRKDGARIGAITTGRSEVRPFTDKQIALLQNFAAQAVIAMENARLLTETREALEQQTATAEVLQVINSSPGVLRPVFDAMLEKATRLCQAEMGALWTYDGEYMHAEAVRGAPPQYAAFLNQGPHHPSAGQRRLLDGERIVHIADLRDDSSRSGDLLGRAGAGLGGIRTLLVVPLRKDNVVLGSIGVYRQDVRPFSEKEINLLESFAAQAVIAMENARLLTETRQALEQQTATAEVLQVINSSPGDLGPVFRRDPGEGAQSLRRRSR